MYGDQQNQSKRTFYCRRPEPSYRYDVQSCSWRTRVNNLSICKMAARLSTLHDKEKENLDTGFKYWDGAARVWDGSKNKKQSIKIVRKRKSTSNAFARQIWQGSTSEVIN